MIFRKNKEAQRQKEETKDVSIVNYETEHALNSRLDGLRFRILNKSEFNAEKESEPHSISQISFVRVFEGGEFSHFELYKGDILILPNAAPTPPVNKFGKVVRINTAIDSNVLKYVNYSNNNRYSMTLPAGETIQGTAVGFRSDTASGTFLFSDASGNISLGSTGNTSSSGAANEKTDNSALSKLSIVVSHENTKQTLTYEIMHMAVAPSMQNAPALHNMLIRINGGHYYVGVGSGNYSNYEYWPGNILKYGTYGMVQGTVKDAGVYGPGPGNYQQLERCFLKMVMPNVHNYNLPSGQEQFKVQLGVFSTYYGPRILNESSSPYHRLGLEYSLDDGSYLGTPTYVECFVPGFTNYEDFLDIAKIICTPTVDTQGNEVDI